ncbi:MAG: BMC domain-containing protein [Lachnospiraceae bacterium]
MKYAMGIIEIQGLAEATVVADCMVKSANVRLHTVEKAKGMGYMTVKIIGDVGAVTAAISAGKQMGMNNGKYITSSVIANPTEETLAVFLPKPKETAKEEAAKEEASKEKVAPKPARKNPAAKKPVAAIPVADHVEAKEKA